MASEIRVNTINNSSGLGTITISDTGHVFSGITTIGSVTIDGGTVTGNLTGNVTGIVTSTGISTFSDTVNVGAGKSIRLYGASSGYSEIVAAAGSASTTFTLPANGGSASQYLQTDGSGTLSWATVADTGVVWGEQTGTSTSGTTFNFSSIPADARETIVTWKNVSANGTGKLRFRIGTSGSLATSGYTTLSGYFGLSQSATNHSTICEFHAGNTAAYDWNGFVRVTRISGNRYEIFGVSSSPSYSYMMLCNSSIDIGGDLGQIEFFWENNVSFDGGDWGIRYLT